MSGVSSNRNQSISYSQVNSQKTLIYDLRSQLSNLKSQFSRLISKPADQSAKSKIQQKNIAKSRYSCVASDTDVQSQLSVSSQCALGARNSDLSAQTNLPNNKADSNIDKKVIPVIEKLGANYRRSSNYQIYTSTTLPASSTYEKPSNQQKKGNAELYSKKQFAAFYRKTQQNAIQHEGKLSPAPPANNKVVVNNNTPVDNSLTQLLAQTQSKNNKLEQQLQQIQTKLTVSMHQSSEASKKLTKTQKQLQELKQQNSSKNDKIRKLQQLVKQINEKSSKNITQTTNMLKQKNKQIQQMKKQHSEQLKNIQVNNQKLISSQRYNLQVKADSAITVVKQQYEKRIKQLTVEKGKIVEELGKNKQFNNNMKLQINDLQNAKQNASQSLGQKVSEINKQNEKIRVLLAKQLDMEKELIQKTTKPESKAVGINTQQNTTAVTTTPTITTTSAVQPLAQQQTNSIPPTTQITNQAQYKQMQDKLGIYLNNIDKQSQKIKQQKSQLQKQQKKIQDSNRLLSQKQLAVRNLMRDCKAMQKDLNQNRRARRQLQILLQQSNTSLTKLNLNSLNIKYKSICAEKEDS